MTQKVGHMKKHLKTSTSSVTTSMQPLQVPILNINEQIAHLQDQISMLQRPQLMYRPPGAEKHIRIDKYLDSIEERLQLLEKDSHKAPRSNHGNRLTEVEQRLEVLENG